jgi:HEAT repeat protein
MALLKSRDSAFSSSAVASVPAPLSAGDLLASLHAGATEAERRDAAADLAALPDTACALGAALGEEASPRVREAIVLALVGIGTPEAAAAIGGFLASEDVPLRNAAVEALQQMGASAGAYVEKLLAAPDSDTRIFAVNVIEALRQQAASGWLRRVLARDPDLNVGLAAVEAIVQFGEPADVAVLRGFAARFPNEPFVTFAVNMACRRIAAGGIT